MPDTTKLNLSHNVNMAFAEIRNPLCRYCNGTGQAQCHPSTCKNHNGVVCNDVDYRGARGCPPCQLCGGTGKDIHAPRNY